LENPSRTAASQNTASATGNRNPSAGRRTCASLPFDGARAASVGSTLAVMETRDMTAPAITTRVARVEKAQFVAAT
jgi:hypothetical protein